MIRSGFKSKAPQRREATQYLGSSPGVPALPFPRVAAVVRPILSLPKDAPRRSEAYRRLVASFECAHCGRAGPSQFAHSDEGKGMGIKSCDSRGFPLCATQPGKPGCHDGFGTLGWFSRTQRRLLEGVYSQATQIRVKALGLWPKGWPL